MTLQQVHTGLLGCGKTIVKLCLVGDHYSITEKSLNFLSLRTRQTSIFFLNRFSHSLFQDCLSFFIALTSSQ